MATPSNRVPVRIARGTKSNLDTAVAASDLKEGEICYATDENALYVIEGGVLTVAGVDLANIEIVDDVTPQLGGPLDVNGSEIVSLANANILVAPDGAGVLELRGNTGNDAAIQLNCETNSHGVKIKSPPHSAAAIYTLVLPENTGTTGQALTTDGAGVLSWATPSTVGSIDDLTDVDTTTTAPTSNQVLAWDGTNWVPVDQTGGSGGGIGEAPEDGTPYARQDATWVPAPTAGGGGGTLDGLSDVDVPSPTTANVLAWDGSEWVSVESAGVTIISGGTSFSAETLANSPLDGGNAILGINNSAWTNLGWTVFGAKNSDEGSVAIPWPAGWSTVEYMDSGVVTDSTNWFLNYNGGIGWDAGGLTYSGRTGNATTDAAGIDFYVSWWSEDTAAINQGYKTVTEDGEDYYIIRCEQKVPYSFAAGSIVIESWFGQNGSIQIRYGSTQNGSGPFVAGNNRNLILTSGSPAYPGHLMFPGLTGSGSYVAKYIVTEASLGPSQGVDSVNGQTGDVLLDDYVSLAVLQTVVADSTDFADFQSRVAAL